MGDRFDEVRQSGEREALAREIKFSVTDMNGWQTAYGYAGGELPRPLPGLGGEAPRRSRRRRPRRSPTRPRAGSSSRLQQNFRRFMELDAVAWHSLQNSDPDRTKRILLGPELRQFETMADTADELADLEVEQATATEDSFDEARDDARKRLIAVALGAGVVIILLLVTANDIARMALEGERRARGRNGAASRRATSPRDPGRPPDAEPPARRGARGTLLGQPPAGPGDPRAGALRRAARAVGARRGRRAVRLDRRPAAVHARRLADPLLRRAQPLARRPAAGLGRARDAGHPRGAR